MKIKVGDKVTLNKSGVFSAAGFLYDTVYDNLDLESLSQCINAALPGEIIDILPEEGPVGESAYMVILQASIPVEFFCLVLSDQIESVNE